MIQRRTPARRSAQRRNARKQWWRRLARMSEITVCTGVIGVFAYFFVQYAQASPDFTIRKVAIHGLDRLDEHDVFRTSGILQQGNVFLFDDASVRTRINALPYVEDCEINRVYPDTISIQIRERIPIASLLIRGDAYEIDPHGVVLRKYAPDEMPREPFITNLRSVDTVAPGDEIMSPGLQSALNLWSAFRRSSLADDLTVAELAAHDPADIRMICDEVPFEIRWGDDDVVSAVRRLEILWGELDGDPGCAAYVDMRFGADIPCK